MNTIYTEMNFMKSSTSTQMQFIFGWNELKEQEKEKREKQFKPTNNNKENDHPYQQPNSSLSNK